MNDLVLYTISTTKRQQRNAMDKMRGGRGDGTMLKIIQKRATRLLVRFVFDRHTLEKLVLVHCNAPNWSMRLNEDFKLDKKIELTSASAKHPHLTSTVSSRPTILLSV